MIKQITKKQLENIKDAIAHLNGYAEIIRVRTGYIPVAVNDCIKELKELTQQNKANTSTQTTENTLINTKPLTIKITEKDLIRLMRENPNINIKKGNQLYFKKELKGGLKEKNDRQNKTTGIKKI